MAALRAFLRLGILELGNSRIKLPSLFLFENRLMTMATNKATPKPSKYNPIMYKPCTLIKPNRYSFGAIKETKKTYTGNLAEQDINGMMKIVMNRSLLFSMERAAIIAGIEQAKPPTSGITDFPFIPKRFNSPSVIKLTRER